LIRTMSKQIRIDYVSDVACPWCAIGLHSLEEALRRTADVVQAQIHFQPFELNPEMRAQGENIDALLGGRYGGGAAQLEKMRESVRARAAEVHFAFNQSATSRVYNTFDAHRLLHWAETQGRQRELKHALFRANFTDNANVSDHAVLVDIAASAGLDAHAARAVLAEGRYADEVRAAEREWQARGISGVPAIVIDEEWVIQGGQPPEAFEQALREIAATPPEG
jgi:predicted DsbA family dithiol-disulfide isomerase